MNKSSLHLRSVITPWMSYLTLAVMIFIFVGIVVITNKAINAIYAIQTTEDQKASLGL